MKVLHVIPSIENQSGGPSFALVQYVNALKPFVEIEIATTDCKLSEKDYRAFCNKVHSIPLHRFDQIGSHSVNLSWPMSEWIRRNITNYDLVHIHALFSPMSTIAAFWARKRGVPYIIRPIGTLSRYTFDSRNRLLKRLYYAVIEKPTVTGAVFLHFTSPIEKEDAAHYCKLNHAVIIPIPIPSYRKEQNKYFAARNILFMSRIHPKKGLELLIKAFRQISGRYPETHLMIAGDGNKSYVAHIRKLVAEEKLENKVRFLGFIDGVEKEQIFGESACFVLPSYSENFSVAVAEAMAAGLPVIVSDQVGIWPDIREFGAGLVVRNEVDSLKQGLDKLLGDEELCRQMGSNGKRLVEEKYQARGIAESLFKLYSEILTDSKTAQALNPC